MKTIADSVRGLSRRTLFTCALLACLALWCWLGARRVSLLSESHASLVGQIARMRDDVVSIEQLRQAPQVATERVQPNDELLSEVRNAMTKAKLAPKRWIGNDPSPPMRIPKSPYKQLKTRLSFDDITLRELAAFSYYLVAENPTLSVTDVRMTAPRSPDGELWKAEITVSYLIYAPYQRQPA